MNYNDYFGQLHEDFALKSDTYIKAIKAVENLAGFADIQTVPELFSLKKDWGISSNNYYGFLAHVRDNGIKPEDELPDYVKKQFSVE
jgi:hypothetical protein